MNALSDLTRPLPFRARRESSYDRTGGNDDRVHIPAHESRAIADITAAGEIRHIWMAVFTDDPYYLRRCTIRMWWDGEDKPSVECPVGDFFCLGHSQSYTMSNACFSTSVNDERYQGEGVALNCWVPMPFRRSARVEFENGTDAEVLLYYYVDWREYDSLPEDTFTFHASWRRENPCVTPPGADTEHNLTDEYNFLLLYAEGAGNYLGVNMSIDNITGEWWGEGDDMIFIDRPEGTRDRGGDWPPDLHGTGSEDYFCHAWGMQSTTAPYSGESWCEDKFFLRAHNCNGKVAIYRFHVADPIPFREKIRVSIEHGHANDRSDDYAVTAYWYQSEPHSDKSFEPLPPIEERLPRPPSKTGRKIATYM